MGFEPTPTYVDQKSSNPHSGQDITLESGALDHSATLTADGERPKICLMTARFLHTCCSSSLSSFIKSCAASVAVLCALASLLRVSILSSSYKTESLNYFPVSFSSTYLIHFFSQTSFTCNQFTSEILIFLFQLHYCVMHVLIVSLYG